jgi:hypothetical protein
MSKRKSRKRVDNAKPTYNVPGPVRAYVEAISAQCDRILSSAKAESLDDRCRQLTAAVNDPQCKRDIEQLFGQAMATLQLLPTESRKQWIQRLGKLAHENKELMRRAENFGVLTQRFLESGRPLLTFLLTGTLANPSLEVETALGEFENQKEQHRKLVNAARAELAVLEEGTFRIKWDKNARELWYRGSVVKKFEKTAVTNQEKVFDKFEEAQWERTIESPFGETKQLGETFRELKSLATLGLEFHALGNRRIEWSEKKRLLP